MSAFMELIFSYYPLVALSAVPLALLVMTIWLLISAKTEKWTKTTIAVITYILVVALGMSSDIKYISLVGLTHGLCAIALATLAIRYIQLRASYLLYMPSVFIAVVALFNLFSENRGLELLGRWSVAA